MVANVSSTVPNNTAIHAPNYALHRDAVDVDDPVVGAGQLADPKLGINMQGYMKAHVQVAPEGGANPSAEVLVWSPAAERFISLSTPITQAGAGADTPYEFTADVLSRLIFVRLSGIAAGQASVFVSGVDLDHLR